MTRKKDKQQVSRRNGNPIRINEDGSVQDLITGEKIEPIAAEPTIYGNVYKSSFDKDRPVAYATLPFSLPMGLVGTGLNAMSPNVANWVGKASTVLSPSLWYGALTTGEMPWSENNRGLNYSNDDEVNGGYESSW